jgi:hypothetical protein
MGEVSLPAALLHHDPVLDFGKGSFFESADSHDFVNGFVRTSFYNGLSFHWPDSEQAFQFSLAGCVDSPSLQTVQRRVAGRLKADQSCVWRSEAIVVSPAAGASIARPGARR